MSRKLIVLAMAVAGILAAQDPPGRVGRLSFVSGSVSFQPGGVDDWVPANINRPLTIGDQLWVDEGGRAEVNMLGTAFRMGSRTAFQFLNLDDANIQVRLSEGTLEVRARRMTGAALEVDTPNLAFTIQAAGDYRIDTNPDNYETYVTVRAGGGEITANGGTFDIHGGDQAVVSGQDGSQYNVYAAPAEDEFETWARSRDDRQTHYRSSRYVSSDVVGYEDLDDYGDWRTSEYGSVWVPRVEAGWAPYRDGHWAWIDPWGWSWVDESPWGFAPFHYGRWANVDGAWGWVPPGRVAPVYAPALVAWVGFGGGGGGVGVSLNFGGEAGVGWFPLGPRDVYVPSYRASEAYVTRINTTNTTVINNTTITNVYNNYTRTGQITNVTYMNRSVPGAVIAVPQRALVNAQPVRQAIVRVQPAQLTAVQNASPAPRVAPQMSSVLGHAAGGSAPRPPAAVISKQVVAKATPPPPPPSFQQRQSAMAQNPGRPMPIQQQRQMTASAPAPQVKVVTQARPVTPTVVKTQAPRTAAAALKPGAQPAPPANMPRPGQPQGSVPAQAGRPPAQPQTQPSRTFEPPAAQPRTTQPAPAPQNRPEPQTQPNRAVQPNAAPPRTAQPAPVQPQSQPSRTYEPNSAQPKTTTPAPAQQNRPQTESQPNRSFEPPSAQRSRPAEESHPAAAPAPRSSQPPPPAARKPAPPPRDEKKKDDKKDEKNQ